MQDPSPIYWLVGPLLPFFFFLVGIVIPRAKKLDMEKAQALARAEAEAEMDSQAEAPPQPRHPHHSSAFPSNHPICEEMHQGKFWVPKWSKIILGHLGLQHDSKPPQNGLQIDQKMVVSNNNPAPHSGCSLVVHCWSHVGSLVLAFESLSCAWVREAERSPLHIVWQALHVRHQPPSEKQSMRW